MDRGMKNCDEAVPVVRVSACGGRDTSEVDSAGRRILDPKYEMIIFYCLLVWRQNCTSHIATNR